MQYGGVCVGGGPVDPLRTVFERAVSVGGVGGRARGSVERSMERTREQGGAELGKFLPMIMQCKTVARDKV